MKYWVVGVFIVFQLLLCDLAAQESLTIQQKVWMYRIISKTPTLHRSLSGFLKYEGPDFYTFDQKVDYELVSQFQTANPNSLSFDYAGIRATSSGIIAELSVKMALWEVNEYLKKYISHDLEFSDVLYAQLEKRLVRKIVGQVKPQKQQELVQVVMHPSLPIFKKLELLQEYSIDPNVKLALFKEWNQLLVKHLFERSQWYFNFLSEENQLMSNLFLAAGEGSGTAGMLYEYELNPNDSTQKWYGKGIGLFNYQLRLHNGEIKPRSESIGKIKVPAGKTVALHSSLWGLDSSFKPMLVFIQGDKSYHLYSDFQYQELTPDASVGNGKSHSDRIHDFYIKEILEKSKELSDSSILNVSLLKQYVVKDEIEHKIKVLEFEIDSLNKLEGDFEKVIKNKKVLIDTHLYNLTAKVKHINEIEDKLFKKHQVISRSKTQLEQMVEVLGPNPQTYILQDSIAKFEDGVYFDLKTQDLVFPSAQEISEIEVRLISGSYSIRGSSKDEVQVCVSLSELKGSSPIELDSEGIYRVKNYYAPDGIVPIFSQKDSAGLTLASLKEMLSNSKYSFSVEIDSNSFLNHFQAETVKYYNDFSREVQLPLSRLAKYRYSEMEILVKNGNVNVVVRSSCDPIPTRLSFVSHNVRQKLGMSDASLENNKYLSVLRSLYELKHLGINLDSIQIGTDNFTKGEIELLLDIIQDK